MNTHERQAGVALVTALMLLALIMTLTVGYYLLTHLELFNTKASMDSFRGFYAAEGGLNVRADLVRAAFEGYNRPGGTTPAQGAGSTPCAAGNTGSGDFACTTYDLQRRTVNTFVEEAPDNPVSIVIPRGERYQNLNAQEYRYAVYSNAVSPRGRPEALLEMQFKSRLVPMFQFAVFYNKDLEILPGPAMSLDGPVHTNGDLYVGTGATLDILGQVTTAGEMYRGRKDLDECMSGPVRVADPDDQAELPVCSGGRELLVQSDLDAWNGMVRTRVETLTVPPPEALAPDPGEIYWDKADIRIVLDLNGATPEIQVRDASGIPNATAGAALAGCGNAAGYSDAFYNNREGTFIQMLDIDVEDVMDCLHYNGLLPGGADINDGSEGGLVWYLGVDGPDSDGQNAYGVRVRNGAKLASSDPMAPEVQGLTIVTNQAAYVEGDFNAANKRPAAFLADSLNVLSNAWTDDAHSELPLADANRNASNTIINAAFLAGTDTTGDVEGPGGQNGAYNGGVENYPRFHEDWEGQTLTYRGSFVSLNQPQHVNGAWVYGDPQYRAPNRDWGYDTDFDSAENLPPLSPRFVYLRQELFVRRFDL